MAGEADDARWSTGQRMDAWTFLIFNLRGRHPQWLDVLMGGIVYGYAL